MKLCDLTRGEEMNHTEPLKKKECPFVAVSACLTSGGNKLDINKWIFYKMSATHQIFYVHTLTGTTTEAVTG